MAENKELWQKLSSIVVVAVAAISLFFMTQGNVNALKKDAVEAKKACMEMSNKEQCYAKVFEGITKKSDMAHAFNVLRRLQQMDTASRGCHFIAHSISITQTEKDPSRWREVMNSAPQDCSYGAVHGALEYYATTFPDGRIPKGEIGKLCNNPDTNNCSHGLGHVLLVINENDIEESASECEALPHEEFAKFECVTGVFMERITALNLETHGLAGKEALNWPARVPELEKLCRAQTGTRSIACWKEIVHTVIVKFNNNTQRVIDFCETAPREKETRECIDHSLGIIAASYQFDLSRMKPMCDSRAKAPDFKERCYPHLVSSVLSTVPQEMPAAKRFCANLEEQFKASCSSMVNNFERNTSGTIRQSD